MSEKTQPQELLEEVIGVTHRNEDEKFPTLQEQQEYWKRKEAEETLPFTCPKCLRKFKSPQAVRMHVARAHDHTILAPNEHPFRVPEGGITKTSRPLKKGETMINTVTGRPVETLATHRKWSLARRRRYNAKKKAAMASYSTGPLPSPWIETPVEVAEPVAMIRFCPHCGKGLERFLA
jgi:uncharacterized C2H2 Zn-finger protein